MPACNRGNGRWEVALHFSVSAMCEILFIFCSGLADVNIAARREEIQLHGVALRFLEGDEVRGAEPTAALGDGRRREHAPARRTN